MPPRSGADSLSAKFASAGVSRGLLITHEGPDGSGKATQAALLRTWLEEQNIPHVFYAFPTYETSSIARLVQTLLRERKDEWRAMPWEARALLYVANRMEYREEILGHLKGGKVVLCDRYAESNLAHTAANAEGAERKHIIAALSRVEFDDLGMPRADLIFLHTMRPEHRRELIAKREGGAGDAHESNDAYLSAVEESYLMMVRDDPNRFIHVPSDENGILQTPDHIHQQVLASLQRHPMWQTWQEKYAVRP